MNIPELDIERELHTRLKLRAVHSWRTVADLVREIAAEALKDD